MGSWVFGWFDLGLDFVEYYYFVGFVFGGVEFVEQFDQFD